MAILNYTTTIDALKTIGEIQACLVKHGATNVSIDFAEREPTALTFLVNLNEEFVNFRLPSNYQGVYKAMANSKDIPNRYKTQAQARKVAWRIVKNWVEAQMAIIEAGLASLSEVFLPYAVTTSGLTLYESVKQNGLKAIAAGVEHGIS